MKKCAYCKKERELTNEHIMPKSIYKRTDDEKNSQFYERADKFLNGEITIGDVCKICNNGVLSKLDNYVTDLWDNQLQNYIEKDEINFEYDYHKLLRWLLKVSYNSARVHGRTNIFSEDIIKYILGEKKTLKNTSLMVQLIKPYKIKKKDRDSIKDQKVLKEGVIYPYEFRISNGINNVIGSNFSRMISLRSFHFVILEHNAKISSGLWKKELNKLEASKECYNKLKKYRSKIKLKTSKKSLIDTLEAHILYNEKTYRKLS